MIQRKAQHEVRDAAAPCAARGNSTLRDYWGVLHTALDR